MLGLRSQLNAMARQRGQWDEASGFPSASAYTLVCPQPEVASSPSGEDVSGGTSRSTARSAGLKFDKNLIGAALFNHVRFPGSKGMKIRRYEMRIRMKGQNQGRCALLNRHVNIVLLSHKRVCG